MRKLRVLWRSMFDVRPGEHWRLTLMTSYLMLVMFAYYILKPVSRALFLNRFDIDELPYLTILVAFVGGVLAYGYTQVALRFSLPRAVSIATLGSAGMLVLIWWLLRFHFPWMIYVFNIWVSLASIVLVSQGWLVAANVFSSREAKRLYGILGVGAVLGAALGGSFTAQVVPLIGTTNLLLASALMVALSYICFWRLLRLRGVNLSEARGAEEESAEFTFFDIVKSISRHRHLQVIIGIITITFIVDVVIEYQFSAMAKRSYQGDDLTAFLGGFYGLYLNLVTFVLQFFLTTFIVNRFGIGGTLQIMPVAIGLSSLAVLALPGVASASALRLAEAATRYSFNRTGMELLYLPLPRELKNRTKAFVDIFADRMARAVGGLLLLFLTKVLHIVPDRVVIVTVILSVLWIILSDRARREYVLTVRGRLETRRLDLQSARVTVTDPMTIRLLEQTAYAGEPRQAAYALSLLGEAPQYRISNLLQDLVSSPHDVVRAEVFNLARLRGLTAFQTQAMAELRRARQGAESPVIRPAVEYVITVSPESYDLARRLLDHQNALVVEATIAALGNLPDLAQELITHSWLSEAAHDSRPERRRLAAMAIGIRGDEGIEVLHYLLDDKDPSVVGAACRAAGARQNRAYLGTVIRKLNDARVRGAAIEALSAYGTKILGTLSDLLRDDKVPHNIRRQIPRVLQAISDQRSVDILVHQLGEPDVTVRSSVIRALSRLRAENAKLDFGGDSLTQHILEEARFYYQISAAVESLQERKPQTPAANLLVRTLESRLKESIERLFRLLGLQYPPHEIYAAYLAMQGRETEKISAALEFLDNILKPELRRFLLPLLDEDAQSVRLGRDLFDIEPQSLEEVLAGLLRSGDSWIVACAISTAAEWELRSLAPRIAVLSRNAGAEVGPVAQAALEALV